MTMIHLAPVEDEGFWCKTLWYTSTDEFETPREFNIRYKSYLLEGARTDEVKIRQEKAPMALF